VPIPGIEEMTTMPTTTTVQRMLEKADDLERQAQVLREAIALMNGDLSERKEKRAGTVIEQALQLRRAQRELPQPQRRPVGRPRKQARMIDPDAKAQRAALIRTFLGERPRTAKEVQEHLAAHGDRLSRDRIRQVFYEMGGGVQAIGKGYKARWGLRGSDTPAPVKASNPASKPGHGQARRAGTAALLEQLSTTDPSTTKELPAIARKVSILLLHGYIKRKGEGYVRTAKPFTP
jgi:hypothetical protein